MPPLWRSQDKSDTDGGKKSISALQSESAHPGATFQRAGNYRIPPRAYSEEDGIFFYAKSLRD